MYVSGITIENIVPFTYQHNENTAFDHKNQLVFWWLQIKYWGKHAAVPM